MFYAAPVSWHSKSRSSFFLWQNGCWGILVSEETFFLSSIAGIRNVLYPKLEYIDQLELQTELANPVEIRIPELSTMLLHWLFNWQLVCLHGTSYATETKDVRLCTSTFAFWTMNHSFAKCSKHTSSLHSRAMSCSLARYNITQPNPAETTTRLKIPPCVPALKNDMWLKR